MKVFVVKITEDCFDSYVGGVFSTEGKANDYGRSQEEEWSAEWSVEEFEVQ
jgi:hypothetical protein